MSRKSAKIASLLASVAADAADPHYAGYFECFNRQLFYEAHDVLEELWLANGKEAPNYSFHKGLIQLAGAFVHLQKNRMRPSVALFNLAEANLRKYPQVHDRLDLVAVLALIADWRKRIEDNGFEVNPLPANPAPVIRLEPGL